MSKKRAVRWMLYGLLLIMAIFCIAAGCANGINNGTGKRETCGINYLVSDIETGWIDGAMNQYILEGETTSEVIAIAEEGYVFIGWSDGVETARRQDKAVKGGMTVYAEFEKEKYTVKYTAGEGGWIKGKTMQQVAYQEDGEPVTAEAKFGYMFAKWSDGNESAERQDTWITGAMEVAAEFARLEKTYQYNYNYATGGDEEKEVKIHIDHMDAAEFPVPVKEHSIFGGWYADKERTIAVTDAKGNLVIGQELFRVQTDTLYAKWTAEEEIDYKILLVFVTEINAHGPLDIYGHTIDLEYTLSEKEQKLCKMIPQKLEEKLNEIFYGLINIEIDAYYTKEPVTNDMISGSTGDPINSPISITAEDIPEVRPLINKYRAVLTTFNLNDYDEKYHSTLLAGLGSRKFAKIYLDSFLKVGDIEVMWNASHEKYEKRWNTLLETYLHEFCHTIEMDFGYADYHDVISTRNEVHKTSLELTEEYLLELAEYEGELVGIPYDYWIGNLSGSLVLARYNTIMTLNGENVFWGKLQRENAQDTSDQIVQKVPYGGTADTVTAIAYPGYRFVEWSDGVTTATRQDENITSYFQVWAIFEPIE